jgi:DsbC/DsbD-like thiol-disulfide interchange protein
VPQRGLGPQSNAKELAKEQEIMTSYRIFIPVVLLLTVFWAKAARAQTPSPVEWTATVKGKHRTFRPGQKLDVALNAKIAPGWHFYALTQSAGSPVIPTTIKVADDQPFELAGDISSSEPVSRMDPTVRAETQFYEDTAAFTVPVKIEKKAPAGRQKLELDVMFQACNDRICLPSHTEKVIATLEIATRHASK